VPADGARRRPAQSTSPEEPLIRVSRGTAFPDQAQPAELGADLGRFLRVFIAA
jgi:hypothetical protein